MASNSFIFMGVTRIHVFHVVLWSKLRFTRFKVKLKELIVKINNPVLGENEDPMGS